MHIFYELDGKYGRALYSGVALKKTTVVNELMNCYLNNFLLFQATLVKVQFHVADHHNIYFKFTSKI